jgi:hypothetical protein
VGPCEGTTRAWLSFKMAFPPLSSRGPPASCPSECDRYMEMHAVASGDVNSFRPWVLYNDGGVLGNSRPLTGS